MSKQRYTEAHIEQLNKQIRENYSHLYTINDSMKTTREGISRMVMLDRYAQKDSTLSTLMEGDLVIVKIKYDPTFPTLGTGFVKSFTNKTVTIEIEAEYVGQIDPEIKQEGVGIITVPINHVSKPLELFFEQIAKRVGHHLAEEEDQKWAKIFSDEMINGNVVPAGRVLYGAGSGTKVTYFNCFVMPMPKDSREGISEHRKEVMEIMSRGGGVGTNGSTLRPKDTIALTVGGTSSGAVSWLNDLSSLTDLVQQGGSRRGAQMIMLQDWHPDILEFIISKMQKPSVLKYISENFKDSHIRQLAKDKLKFEPFTNFERQSYELALNSTSDAIKNEAQRRLDEGGKYSVHKPNFLTGANISVGITSDFMKALKSNGEYELRFPDIEAMTKEQKQFYDDKWHEIGDVREWDKMGYPVKTYHTMEAQQLWDLINFCATYSAEPGIFFIDRANEQTNAKAYNQKVVCTNPCGEQPLAPYSVCNLAAINLANMVDHHTGEILWDRLESTVKSMVRMQDNIIDKTPYFLEANKIQATGERRIGMGVMGLHDFLIWNGKRYGSDESNKVVDKLFEKIATTAYITSAELASEKGSFSFLKDVDSLLTTGYISKMPDTVKDAIKKHGGLRNSHLLTIAPTGSTGTMMGVSTGLEPYFAFKYFRSGRLGKFMEVDQAIVAEWKEINNWDKEELPEIFVSAMKLAPEEHADTQCIIQRWIDSSISKTVNAPKGYTVKQVEQIYTRLYDKGAKGGTVYVDGSRDAQVLSLESTENESDTKVEDVNEIVISESFRKKTEKIKVKHANVPGMKQDKSVGIKVGDVCPICKEGTVEDLGGCNSCTNCGAQLKCGI